MKQKSLEREQEEAKSPVNKALGGGDLEHGEEKGEVCYSISELTKMIQDKLEGAFPAFWLKGEVSNFVAHSSGHWYFTLKDAQSQIRAVMFRSANQALGGGVSVKGGQEVKVYGNISVYGARGEYQIICRNLKECGKGALSEEFERIKKLLNKEGLFEKKRALPILPKHIGIISSPTGAAIQDILNILKRRHKGVRVTLIPAVVQGEQAEGSLLKALFLAQTLNKKDPVDVLILTRGGGSLEDLWAFNSEKLARSLFNFPKPVISAIGHEIDFSISDFVADLRAPTPSAAAELVVKNAMELKDKVSTLQNNLYQSIKREFSYCHQHLKRLQQTLISPQKKLHDLYQYLDELSFRFKKTMLGVLDLKKQNLKSFHSLLTSFSPLKVLKRGYSLVKYEDHYIKDASQLKVKDDIEIQLMKGVVFAQVTKIKK